MFTNARKAWYNTDSRKIRKALAARGYTVYRDYRLVDQDPEAFPLDRDDITLYRNPRGREVMLRALPGGRCELYSRIPADQRGYMSLGRRDYVAEMLDALDSA